MASSCHLGKGSQFPFAGLGVRSFGMARLDFPKLAREADHVPMRVVPRRRHSPTLPIQAFAAAR